MPSNLEVSLPAGFIRALSAASTQEQMLRAAADWLPRVLDVERTSICLPDGAHHLELYAFGGVAEVIRTEMKIPIATSLIGQAYRQRRIEVLDDATDSDFEDLTSLVEAGLRSAAAAPMLSGGRCFGTINMADSQLAAFTDVHCQLLQAIADLLGGSLGLVQIAEQEKIRAMTDDLTGALNRGAVISTLDELFADERSQPSLLFLDLDGFKLINDIHGHNVGDQVLRILANRITSRLGDAATLGRLGGDEFLVVVHNDADGTDAESLAAAILDVCGDPVVVKSLRVELSISIGVAYSNLMTSSAADLLADADRAMYQAKESGAQVVVADDEIRRSTAMLTAIDRDLDLALSNRTIVFHYQPVRELTSGRITGAEALIRWQHPTYGPIPPPLLIDRIEATGRVAAFTRWSLDTVARDMTVLRRAVPSFQGRLGINLSPLQLAMTDCAELHSAACARYGLLPNELLVEVVESSEIRPGDEAERTLCKLAESGAVIGLDDFGTGHNALGYFTRFPIHMMKFDRSLVGVMAASEEAFTILKAMASMCRELGISSVAEGVEQQEEMDLCRQFGIDYGQGWHLGKPKPLEDLIVLLQAEALDEATEPKSSSPIAPSGYSVVSG